MKCSDIEKVLNEKLPQNIRCKIVSAFLNQNREYQKKPRNAELFAAEYGAHHKEMNFNWAMFSAFKEDSCVTGTDLKVYVEKDGSGHTRPKLENDNITIHILSKSASLHAGYLKPFYEMNSNYKETSKLYCIIRFYSIEQNLIKIELQVPDFKGNIIYKVCLWKFDDCLGLTA